MGKMNWKTAGWVLGFCFLGTGITRSDSSATPVSTSPQLVLHVQTADGKALQAPVVKFKALSLAVIVTLIKEGKMSPSQAPKNDPSGYITFYLDKNVSAGFVNWAKSSFGHTSNGSNDSGEFTWPAKNGNPAETFKMRGLKVAGFVPAEGSDGVQLVLAADKTEAFPPINFSKSKK
jgi:hypothetical protein